MELWREFLLFPGVLVLLWIALQATFGSHT